MIDWPVASLDPVRRLRVLAAGVSGAAVTQGLVEAPFPVVWALVHDLEGSFGEIVTDMRSVRVVHLDGHRVQAMARSRLGFRAKLSGELSPGWCWLQSRFLLVGVAARPAGTGTLVAVTGGVRVPGRAALVPVGIRREGRRALSRLAELVR